MSCVAKKYTVTPWITLCFILLKTERKNRRKWLRFQTVYLSKGKDHFQQFILIRCTSLHQFVSNLVTEVWFCVCNWRPFELDSFPSKQSPAWVHVTNLLTVPNLLSNCHCTKILPVDVKFPIHELALYGYQLNPE